MTLWILFFCTLGITFSLFKIKGMKKYARAHLEKVKWFFEKKRIYERAQELNELDRLLLAARTTPEKRIDFFKAVLDSKLYIKVERPDSLTTDLKQETAIKDTPVTKVNIPWIPGKEGNAVFPVFSSLEKLRAYYDFAQAYYFSGSGRELFESILSSDKGKENLVIGLNLGMKASKGFHPGEIRALLSEEMFDSRAHQVPGSMSVGIPSKQPTKLIAYLKDYFKKYPEVEAAYLVLANYKSKPDEGLHFIIAIKSPRSVEPLIPELRMIMGELLEEDDLTQIVDVINFDQVWEPVKAYMIGETKPFYTSHH